MFRALVLSISLVLSSVVCLPALTPEEAARHLGSEGAVDGVAVQVSEAGGNVFVNLGAKFPNHTFSAFVAKADVATVGLDYLKSLEGKPVSVVGRIADRKGKPQIQVTKKEQIILVAQPPTAPVK